jgi:hypothetical protein
VPSNNYGGTRMMHIVNGQDLLEMAIAFFIGRGVQKLLAYGKRNDQLKKQQQLRALRRNNEQ